MSVICRLPQGGGSSDLIDFPLTIGETQPTADTVGHLWVDTPFASSITSVVISDAFTSSMPNGTMLLLVSSLDNFSYSFSHTKLDTEGKYRDISMANSNGSNTWTIINKNGLTYSIPKPMIYTKVGDNIYLEDAYWWNGTTWDTLTNKGKYFMFSNPSSFDATSSLQLYSYSDAPSFSLHTDVMSLSYSSFGKTVKSKDGSYIGVSVNGQCRFYKRTGDVFAPYGTASIGGDACMSDDGQYYGAAGYSTVLVNGYNVVRCTVTIYKNNGVNGFDIVHTTPYYEEKINNFNVYYEKTQITCNSDGSCFVVLLSSRYDNGTNYRYTGIPFFKNTNETWSVGTRLDVAGVGGTTSYLTFLNNQKIVYQAKFLSGSTYGDYSLYMYTVDYVNKIMSSQVEIPYSANHSIPSYLLGYVGDVIYFIKNKILYTYNYTTNKSVGNYTIPTNIVNTDLALGGGSISQDGKYIILHERNSAYYYVRFLKTTINQTNFLLTELTSVGSIPVVSDINYLTII